MERFTAYACRVFLLLTVVCVHSLAQNPPPKQNQPDDVIRVNTELIQTGVVVLDKQGHFVNGLQRDQFELNVEGKPQPITFFEQVKAGSARESARLAALNGKEAQQEGPSSVNEDRGRTIVFFIDDLHLSLDSLARTRKTLTQFIDNEMNDNDRVAIASTSGDIGFLQQFSDNKSVLRAAAGRLTYHPYKVRDMTDVTTPMTEYMALTIERKDDPGVLDFYIDECLKAAFPLRYTRQACEVQVKSRARLILLQAASVILNTYDSLESLMRSSASLPGRKIVFFISDGFLLDTGPRNSDPRGKLRVITDAALRAGVVIYTIDARGLFSGQLDATNNVPFDAQGRLESASLREGSSAQDALNALAGDTGGRALRNQNYFDRWVGKILDETSNYYLLAWRPNSEAQTSSQFKNISARVIDHPEYAVRLPSGFLNTTRTAPVKSPAIAEAPAQPHRELQDALTALHPKHEIPLMLSVVYLDTPEHGPVLTASVRVANDALSYEAVAGTQIAAVDVVGVVVDDRGKPAKTFQTRLTINSIGRDSKETDESATIYNYRVPLKPGLYQVRIASRDTRSGQVGSAQQWIEIPDLSLHHLSLSSLLLGLQNVERTETAPADGSAQVQFSTDHRFARDSRLRFITFIYNAALSHEGKPRPNLWLQARILHGGQVVKSTPVQSVPLESEDMIRIPFGGEIGLDSIPSGQYILEITVDDQIAREKVSQRARITVE